MIVAVDTSSLRRYLEGRTGRDVALVATAARSAAMLLPPVVVAEALSDPEVGEDVASRIAAIPQLPVIAGYWERAGRLRARLKSMTRKAALADCLVAQSCIDHHVPLITHDRDFRSFTDQGLRLL